MVRVANGTLNQKISIAIGLSTLTIELLVYKWHKEVAQGVHGQNGNVEIPLHQRQPANTVVLERVNAQICLEAANFRGKRSFLSGKARTISPAINPVGVVVEFLGQNSGNCAV